MNELTDTAAHVLEQFLNLDDEETVGLVIDRDNPVTEAFREAIHDYKHRIIHIPLDRPNNSPIPDAYEELAVCDAIIAPTENSITHSEQTTKLREQGKRFITLPGVTPTIFKQIREADQRDIQAREQRIHEVVAEAVQVHITSPSGTDLELQLDPDRPWHRSRSTVRPGEVRNLPNGEIFTAPREDGATGTVVIDIWEDIRTENDAVLHVEHGRITDWTDGAAPLVNLLDRGGENGRVIAELGIGTNKAHDEPMGITANDEKMYGTCHVAFGQNTSFGGTNEAGVHQDVIIDDPTLTVEGERLEY